jgi:uncharacterized protein (TIGR03000 family)
MYSAVLMLAMAGAGDTPAGLFDHHSSCCGCSCSCWGGDCYGCCGGYSCCGGGHGHHGGGHGHHGCCGGGGHHFGRHGHHGHHDCCGGCCGGYGCGGGYGCCGGWGGCCGGGYGCCGGGYGCCGGGYGYCGGGYACAGGCACDGAVPVAPGGGGTIREGAPKEKGKGDKGDKGTMAPAPATIIVSLPADATLSIDDAVTSSTSDRRVFVSPELNPGREYHYTLKAEWNRDGKAVVVTKEVAVSAGNETTVTMEAGNAASVASR